MKTSESKRKVDISSTESSLKQMYLEMNISKREEREIRRIVNLELKIRLSFDARLRIASVLRSCVINTTFMHIQLFQQSRYHFDMLFEWDQSLLTLNN